MQSNTSLSVIALIATAIHNVITRILIKYRTKWNRTIWYRDIIFQCSAIKYRTNRNRTNQYRDIIFNAVRSNTAQIGTATIDTAEFESSHHPYNINLICLPGGGACKRASPDRRVRHWRSNAAGSCRPEVDRRGRRRNPARHIASVSRQHEGSDKRIRTAEDHNCENIPAYAGGVNVTTRIQSSTSPTYYVIIYTKYWNVDPAIFSARFVGGWGFNPLSLWCLSTLKFVLPPPEKIVKVSQKYIADPSLWFSHKSNTEYLLTFKYYSTALRASTTMLLYCFYIYIIIGDDFYLIVYGSPDGQC